MPLGENEKVVLEELGSLARLLIRSEEYSEFNTRMLDYRIRLEKRLLEDPVGELRAIRKKYPGFLEYGEVLTRCYDKGYSHGYSAAGGKG